MMRHTPAALSVVPVPAPPMKPSSPSPRVQVFPSADGTILLVGVTLEGRWIAEYRCLAEDFDDRCVTAMERKVRAKERHGPQLVV